MFGFNRRELGVNYESLCAEVCLPADADAFIGDKPRVRIRSRAYNRNSERLVSDKSVDFNAVPARLLYDILLWVWTDFVYRNGVFQGHAVFVGSNQYDMDVHYSDILSD